MIAAESRLLLQGNDIRALTAVAAQGAYPAHMRARETIEPHFYQADRGALPVLVN
jgi:hypothetical protein